MEIEINKTNGMVLEMNNDEKSIILSKSPDLNISIDRVDMTVNPVKSSGVEFGFVSRIIAGGAVRRMTKVAFEALTEKDEELWYFVTNTSGSLREIYAGSTLFAKADSGGNIGFPYTFPMTF